VVGTLGSWGFYVLGIFMSTVYILGPKTAFGQSEQNPAYWIQLLIAAKATGARVTWFDPVANEQKEREIKPGDIRIWTRFIMSYLINGVGFHVLVHALPIQVATQSSLTGVVIRAVGMMYLVDLDDTSGYKLTIVEEPLVPPAGTTDMKTDEDGGKKDENPMDKKTLTQMMEMTGTSPLNVNVMSQETQKILDEAKAKLDALARGEYNPNPTSKFAPGGMLAGGAVLMAGELAEARQEANNADQYTESRRNQEAQQNNTTESPMTDKEDIIDA
jgi:hypothetical protein